MSSTTSPDTEFLAMNTKCARSFALRAKKLSRTVCLITVMSILGIIVSDLIVSPYEKDLQQSSDSELSGETTSYYSYLTRGLFQREASETSQGTDRQEVKEELRKRFPNCIIIGVSKCGTRAVMEFLHLHPDVVGPSVEVNYFDHPEVQEEQGLGWYLHQMPESYPHQVTLEKSPDYFQCPEAPKLVRAVNKDVKLVLILRDPVERLVSMYMQLKDKHDGKLPSFKDWVTDIETGTVDADSSSVALGIYANFLANWYKTFPPEQILIVESNAFTSHPYDEMTILENFLNLKQYFTKGDFSYNSTKGFYCMKSRGTRKERCLGASKGRKHIAVDQKLLDKLYRFYRPHNEKLFEMINRTFPWNG